MDIIKKTQLKILKLLIEKQNEQFSMNRIAHILKKPYAHIYNLIQDLVKKKIVRLKPIPPAQIVLFSDSVPKDVLVTVEQFRTEEFLKKSSWLKLYMQDVARTAPHPFFILVIFGSYAKGTQTSKSDIDILMIIPNKEEMDIFEPATEHYTKVKKSVIIVDTEGFLEMVKNTTEFNVGNEARKHHFILHNIETYYDLLRRVYK